MGPLELVGDNSSNCLAPTFIEMNIDSIFLRQQRVHFKGTGPGVKSSKNRWFYLASKYDHMM